MLYAAIWRESFRQYESERSPWYTPADEEEYDPGSGALITSGLTRSEYSRVCVDSPYYRRVILKTDCVQDYRFAKYKPRRSMATGTRTSDTKDSSSAIAINTTTSAPATSSKSNNKGVSRLNLQSLVKSGYSKAMTITMSTPSVSTNTNTAAVAALDDDSVTSPNSSHNNNLPTGTPRSLGVGATSTRQRTQLRPSHLLLKEVNSSLSTANTSWGDHFETTETGQNNDNETSSSSKGFRSSSITNDDNTAVIGKHATTLSLPWTQVFPNPNHPNISHLYTSLPAAATPSEDKILFQSASATVMTLEYKIIGDLVLTAKYLYFKPKVPVLTTSNNHTKLQPPISSSLSRSKSNDVSSPLSRTNSNSNINNSNNVNPKLIELMVVRRYQLDGIKSMFARRQNFKNCGLEIYFVNFMELFVYFDTLLELRRFYDCLRKQYLPLVSLSTAGSSAVSVGGMNSVGASNSSLDPQKVFQKLPYTDLWRKRQISNYEYLMSLNLSSSRSFNDTSQYPVFPWVLADYSSTSLDLRNPRSYRDLSKPIGALDEARLQAALERYSSFDVSTEIPFLYGSHYSSEGVVVHFLIRQEPFTSLAVKLQDGRFDVPDRLFFNLASTWLACSQTSSSDVKELGRQHSLLSFSP